MLPKFAKVCISMQNIQFTQISQSLDIGTVEDSWMLFWQASVQSSNRYVKMKFAFAGLDNGLPGAKG